MPEIVVLGDINLDLTGRLQAPPLLGGDCLAPALEIHCGGVGVNTAVTLNRLGVAVRLLGCTGRDWFGDFLLESLKRERIDVSFVRRVADKLTGLILVATAPDGQRTMFGSRGANTEAPAGGAPREWLGGARAAHLMGYNFLSPSVAQAATELLAETHRHGGWVSLDAGMGPSEQVPQTVLQVARSADILFVSADEAATLTGKHNTEEAYRSLEQSGIRSLVVKLGERGCLFRDEAALRQAPAFSVPVVDTTGSGDAFTAAFLRGRLRGWPAAETALLANAAGATAACVMGAGEQMPTPEKIARLLTNSRLVPEWEPVRTRAAESLAQELRLGDSSGGQHGSRA